MIVLTVGVFVVMLLRDLPAIIRARSWRTLAVFSFFAVLALIYMLRFTMHKEVFSFIKWLSEFTRDKLGLSYEFWQGHV